jgi:hypothetical protein
MNKNNIDLRIRMGVDFGDFESFDIVGVDSGALETISMSACASVWTSSCPEWNRALPDTYHACIVFSEPLLTAFVQVRKRVQGVGIIYVGSEFYSWQ